MSDDLIPEQEVTVSEPPGPRHGRGWVRRSRQWRLFPEVSQRSRIEQGTPADE